MSNFSDKNKYPIYILPETMDKVDEMYRDNGFESRSEFIERAINFYCGYITSDKCKDYLPDVIVSTVCAKLDAMENRIGNLLFKTAVELSMNLHVTSTFNDVDKDTLTRLRGLCIDEVKRLRGNILLDSAVEFQKG